VAQVNVQAEKLIKDKFVHADVVEYTVQYRGRTNKKYPPTISCMGVHQLINGLS